MLSINADTGAVIWDTTLLPPVPASALPCGDITPVQVQCISCCKGTAVSLRNDNSGSIAPVVQRRCCLRDASMSSRRASQGRQ